MGKRQLYHHWIHPLSKKAAMCLLEKGLEFDIITENIWNRRPDFLAINPAGEVPVLIEPNGQIICSSQAICEYLEEAYPENTLQGTTLSEKAEIRRLNEWFDHKFNREVTENILGEKLIKRYLKLGEPHTPSVRAGLSNIHYHLDYMGYLLKDRKWLAGDHFSLADISAMAQLSCLDYIGDVPWSGHPIVKKWYQKIKKRPSFNALKNDEFDTSSPDALQKVVDF